MRLLAADKRVDVNMFTPIGYTPLALAVQQGHLKIVEDHGASQSFEKMIWRYDITLHSIIIIIIITLP